LLIVRGYKPLKTGPGFSIILLGLGLCVVALLGLAGAFGPVPPAGRAHSATYIGLPAGMVVIAVGLVQLVRQRRE
jgi:hypothetical protein